MVNPARAPGGEVGAGDQLLDGQLAGLLVREALALLDVPGQGGPDAGAGAGGDGVEGHASAVGHEADVGLDAVPGHAVPGGVVDDFREDCGQSGPDVGGAHAEAVEVPLQGAGQFLGLLHGVAGGGPQGLIPVFRVHVSSRATRAWRCCPVVPGD